MTTIRQLPDEILVKILALVPFSANQCLILTLVNRKFRNVMDSVSFRWELARYQCSELVTLWDSTPLSRKTLAKRMLEEHMAVQTASKLTKDSDPNVLQQILLCGVRLLNYLCLNLVALDKFSDREVGDVSLNRYSFLLITRETSPDFWKSISKVVRFAIWRLLEVMIDFEDGIPRDVTATVEALVNNVSATSGHRAELSTFLSRRAFEISILLATGSSIPGDMVREGISHEFSELMRRMMESIRVGVDGDTSTQTHAFAEEQHDTCLAYLERLPVWLDVGETDPSSSESMALENSQIRNFFAEELAKDRKLEREIEGSPQRIWEEVNQVDLEVFARFVRMCFIGALFVRGKLDDLPTGPEMDLDDLIGDPTE